MPAGSSPKRERQYEQILQGERRRGVPEGRAKEIAARTVNKERARSGEARPRPAPRRRPVLRPPRGLRSGSPGPRGRTREQLTRRPAT